MCLNIGFIWNQLIKHIMFSVNSKKKKWNERNQSLWFTSLDVMHVCNSSEMFHINNFIGGKRTLDRFSSMWLYYSMVFETENNFFSFVKLTEVKAKYEFHEDKDEIQFCLLFFYSISFWLSSLVYVSLLNSTLRPMHWKDPNDDFII